MSNVCIVKFTVNAAQNKIALDERNLKRKALDLFLDAKQNNSQFREKKEKINRSLDVMCAT